MEKFEASKSTNNETSAGADQVLNPKPNGKSIGHDSSMGSDQPSHPMPNDQSVDPDFMMGIEQTSGSISNELPLGTDPFVGVDQSLVDFDYSDFYDADGNLILPPMITPTMDPLPNFWDPSFDDLPSPMEIVIKTAASEEEITTLHAQLLEEYHRLAQKVGEGLHSILGILQSILAALEKNPITYTSDKLAINTTEKQSCLEQIDPLVQACKNIQQDGLALRSHDEGGYGVLCATFEQVAYKFTMYEIVGELCPEDWFEVFVGMRERITRMEKDGLYRFSMMEGAKVLWGRSPESPKSPKPPKSPTSLKSEKTPRGGKVKVKVEEEVDVKWERDGDGRLKKR